VFLAAWLEQVGTTNRIVVSRSLDHGATWDAPITLAFGTGAFSSPVMYAYRRSSGTMGAVVAWSDPATPTPGRVVTTFWRGTGWTINDWSTVAPLSTNVTGSARQVALAGVGENVFAAWADPRGAPVGGTGVFISRSTNGGQSWQQDALIGIPVGTSAVGSDPAVALELDGDVYVAWSAADGVRVVRSPDNGLNFSAPRTLGPGFGPSIATGDDDRIAVAWTGVGGDAADEAQHFVSLALSYDDLVTIDTPTAMPGSASIRSRTQARAFLAGASLDMAWIDVTGGQRAVQHRTARLP
jgi:hypothetical protein